jgi:retron-type reverse transcriptase
MRTYKNLYQKVCSFDNLISEFRKARKGKNYESELKKNLKGLQNDLINKNYSPYPLKKFIIRDPKTRTIHASIFRDRIVHHAIINILNPIYEKIFICDSFASRKNKGTHNAINRFESFIKKISSNGRLIKNNFNNNSIQGYVLKADFKRYFNSVNHEVLVSILKKKINDEDLISLIKIVLNNFEISKGIGMPLGNYTSQFFANVYLNELDYYVKHILRVKYYIRYVDDFVILHKNKKRLKYFLEHINNFLPCLKIKLHPEKTEIHALRNGINFLGYRIFYHYKLLRKRNIRYFMKKLEKNISLYNDKEISEEQFESRINGWLGYAKFGNTFNLMKKTFSNKFCISTLKTIHLYS